MSEDLLRNCANCSTARAGLCGIVEYDEIIQRVAASTEQNALLKYFERVEGMLQKFKDLAEEDPSAPIPDFADRPVKTTDERIAETCIGISRRILQLEAEQAIAIGVLDRMTTDCPGLAPLPDGDVSDIREIDRCQSPIRAMWAD